MLVSRLYTLYISSRSYICSRLTHDSEAITSESKENPSVPKNIIYTYYFCVLWLFLKTCSLFFEVKNKYPFSLIPISMVGFSERKIEKLCKTYIILA